MRARLWVRREFVHVPYVSQGRMSELPGAGVLREGAASRVTAPVEPPRGQTSLTRPARPELRPSKGRSGFRAGM